jgi:hypothetical protein
MPSPPSCGPMARRSPTPRTSAAAAPMPLWPSPPTPRGTPTSSGAPRPAFPPR